MSTINILQLLPGRWKGISFLVNSETLTQVGQRYIIHTYPGTKLQYAEAHGQMPFNATMPITFSGATYKTDFQNFQRAMNDPNPGTLFMPTMGVYTNVVAMPADVPIDQATLGEITFTVTFSETVAQPSPTQTAATQEDVFTQGSQVISDIENSFTDNFISPDTANNFQTAFSDITSIVGVMKKISGITSLETSITQSLSKLISNPGSLASFLFDPIAGLVTTCNNGIMGSPNAYNNSKILATVGNLLSNSIQDIVSGFVLKQTGTPQAVTINTEIPTWPSTTWEQQQRNDNRYCIVNSFRIAGLVIMCEQAGLQTFTTVQQVQSVISDIHNYFSMIIENDTFGFIIQDCKKDLETLKNNTISTLNSISQQLNNTGLINIALPISSRQLAYELYGEYINNSNDWDYFTNILIALNSSQPVHQFNGSITVLLV